MDVKQHRVMNVKTGRVQVVTSQWLENAKQFGIMADFELIGEFKETPTKTIEEIPTVYIPKKSDEEPVKQTEIIENKEVTKSKKGRKPKQK